MEIKQYVAIDLKSFYASVECVERGVDPITSYLVVADESRTEKTICLAVSPAPGFLRWSSGWKESTLYGGTRHPEGS